MELLLSGVSGCGAGGVSGCGAGVGIVPLGARSRSLGVLLRWL